MKLELTVQQKEWLKRHLENYVRVTQEDVELSGRYQDLETAAEVALALGEKVQ